VRHGQDAEAAICSAVASLVRGGYPPKEHPTALLRCQVRYLRRCATCPPWLPPRAYRLYRCRRYTRLGPRPGRAGRAVILGDTSRSSSHQKIFIARDDGDLVSEVATDPRQLTKILVPGEHVGHIAELAGNLRVDRLGKVCVRPSGRKAAPAKHALTWSNGNKEHQPTLSFRGFS